MICRLLNRYNRALLLKVTASTSLLPVQSVCFTLVSLHLLDAYPTKYQRPIRIHWHLHLQQQEGKARGFVVFHS